MSSLGLLAVYVVTVDPGSNPDHDKLGGEIGKVKCVWGEGALARLAKMSLKPVIASPMLFEPT
jgi:hypothetical protein